MYFEKRYKSISLVLKSYAPQKMYITGECYLIYQIIFDVGVKKNKKNLPIQIQIFYVFKAIYKTTVQRKKKVIHLKNTF